MTQIKIYDRENDVMHGAIILDDGNLICGCCGSLIEKDEVSIAKCETNNVPENIREFYENNNDSDCTTDIIEVYGTWVDLSDEIIGD